MQEVFENIIERLANIGWVFADYYPDGTNISRVSKKSVPYDEVVEIVKQAAAEYNNGWIPCSERLPENVDHLADGDKKKQYLVMTRNGRYEVAEWLEVYDKPFWCGHYSQEIKDVIRWKPLEPYQPKGE